MKTETKTKGRPILFSAPMVRAILAGRKTQTRRVIKFDNLSGRDRLLTYSSGRVWASVDEDELSDDGTTTVHGGQLLFDADRVYTPVVVGGGAGRPLTCPYGAPGDELWVRETWADVNCEGGPAICYKADNCIRTWHEFSETFGPNYGAGPSMDYDAYPSDYTMWWSDLLNGSPGHRWKPSIHMPRWASRIQLVVENVRVERVQEISLKDIHGEGIACSDCWTQGTQYENFPHDDRCGCRNKFRNLWDQINGKKHPYDSNPWVWVGEFHRIPNDQNR